MLRRTAELLEHLVVVGVLHCSFVLSGSQEAVGSTRRETLCERQLGG